MNRIEYFGVSNQKGLQPHCPILTYCSRRAETIYLFSEYKNDKRPEDNDCYDTLIRIGVLPNNFLKNQILTHGESPTIIRGRDYFSFHDCCPEINLFESSHSLIRDIACTDGSYDEAIKYNKLKVNNCQHYSECPEFSYFMFNKKTGQGKKRKSIPAKTKAHLQKEINSTCPFCPSKDVGHFQIHHIDENIENNEMNNLLMLCPTCHSKITKRDILENEVIRIKTNLNQNNN